MMTSTLLMLMLLLLALCLAGVAILSLVLNYRSQIRWMRIFSETQGVSVESMEGKLPEKEPFVAKAKKKLFSMPLPGADWIRGMRK